MFTHGRKATFYKYFASNQICDALSLSLSLGGTLVVELGTQTKSHSDSPKSPPHPPLPYWRKSKEWLMNVYSKQHTLSVKATLEEKCSQMGREKRFPCLEWLEWWLYVHSRDMVQQQQSPVFPLSLAKRSALLRVRKRLPQGSHFCYSFFPVVPCITNPHTPFRSFTTQGQLMAWTFGMKGGRKTSQTVSQQPCVLKIDNNTTTVGWFVCISVCVHECVCVCVHDDGESMCFMFMIDIARHFNQDSANEAAQKLQHALLWVLLSRRKSTFIISSIGLGV